MSRTPADFQKQRDQLRAAAGAAGRAFETIDLSLRFNLDEALLAQGTQAVIDRLAEYKRLGLHHVAVVFRREDLGRMLEILDLVTGTIRPAVDRA
jgi:uncharacterized protein YfaA (DUF2138 family)